MGFNLAWLHPFWALRPADRVIVSDRAGRCFARSILRADRVGRGLDALPMFLCRLLGRREPAEMDWKRYCLAFLAFNLALFVLTFGLLYAQQYLPLNPDNKGSLGALGYKDTAGVTTPAPTPASSSTPSARS